MKMKRRGAKKLRKGKKEARGEADAMNVELWKDFPEELIEAVIARLPIPTLLRFRLVCRKWNSLLKSPHFQQLWSNSAPQKYPLLFSIARFGYGVDTDTIGALYDPSTEEWCYNKNVPPSFYCGAVRAASAGGLVCYCDLTGACFRVGNCLTQTWKEFPWPCRVGERDVVLGMVTLNQDYSQFSSGTGAYKIIWASGGRRYHVYDSMMDTTSSTSSPISEGRIPANIKLSGLAFCRTVSIDNVVYFLTSEPHGIISYDVVSGEWEQFLIPSRHVDAFDNFIAECGGRLLLVGVPYMPYMDAAFSVGVWELEKTMLCWKEVDRMPTSWCSEFNKDPGLVYFGCMGNRSVLVISLRTERRSWIVTYDVVNREWSKAPRFTIPGRYPKDINGVAFFPSLSASP